MSITNAPTSEILLYQTEDGSVRLDVRLQDESLWLTQLQMAELFQKDKRTISEHIQNIFAEGELDENSVVRNFRTTAADTKKYLTKTYNLDVIISVGYRVRSHRGTQFRIWATQRLKEYLIKGFALDDKRLKENGQSSYFDELLARIRDIRSSEKIFWRKVLDIYSTSIDYTKDSELSKQFFKTVQNKMHWAAHGKTAAEVIAARVDATKPNIGLTSWAGNRPERNDIMIAKNYLSYEEIDVLNRLVSMYLDFAELQIKNRRIMHMQDWITKLDDFLRLSEREILNHAGSISHTQALEKANEEYEKYNSLEINQTSLIEQHFIEMLELTKELEKI